MSSATHDTKSDIRARGIMSFLLFAFIFLLSVAICVRSTVTNAEFVKSNLITYDYAAGVCDNISEYIDNKCAINGFEADGIKEIVNYDLCYKLIDQYVGGTLGNEKGYIESTAQGTIDEIKPDITKAIKDAVSKTSYTYDESVANEITDEICNYIYKTVSIEKFEIVKAVTNIGKVALTVAIAGLGVFVSVFCLITYFIGVKRYRSLRAISSGFLSAGILDILISIMIVIISKIKHIDFYPLYLRGAFMNCFNSFVIDFIVVGLCMILVAFMFATIIWLRKKKLQ